MQELLKNFIKDIRIESVKFRLQTAVPHAEIQHNDLMGNFDHKLLDTGTISGTLGKELKKVESLLTVYDYLNRLTEIVRYWNEARLEIQYCGYFTASQRSEAYCYVLLQRILKRYHKELYKTIKKRLTMG